MTPRHQPLTRHGSRPAADPPKAARLRWFLVAHLLAVLLIYATALLVGGGLASPPFPPDVPGTVARRAAPPAQTRTPTATPAPAAPRGALVLPTAAPDLAAPWAPDGARHAE